MLVVACFDILSDVFFRNKSNKLLHAPVVIDKVCVIGLAVNHSATGIKIKINSVFPMVIGVPYIKVSERIIDKIAVWLAFVKTASVE